MVLSSRSSSRGRLQQLRGLLLLAVTPCGGFFGVAKTSTWNATEADCTLPAFAFDDGSVLDLTIHYRHLGSDRGGGAVLLLHGTGGDGREFLSDHFAGVLFDKGQLLDADRHLLIMPDNIGHGGSSRPSASGLRMAFPKYTYADMIRAQQLLVSRCLRVSSLRLVLGTSMGGMHAWMWGAMFPTFVQALMPLASLPAPMSGRNRMFRDMIMHSITQDPAWRGGNYSAQPLVGLRGAVYTLIIMVSVPLLYQKEAPSTAAADALFTSLVSSHLAHLDANDMLYAFNASTTYDPTRGLPRIQAPLYAVNSADDQVNPPELGLLEAGTAPVARGRCVVLPISNATRGHGTHSYPALWKQYLAALLDEALVVS